MRHHSTETNTARHRGRWLATVAVTASIVGAPLAWVAHTASAATGDISGEASPHAQDFQATENILPYILPADLTYRTVLTVGIRNDYLKPALVEISSALTARNDGGGNANAANAVPATLRMRVLIDGKPEPGEFATTINPAAFATLTGYLNCNGVPPGNHTIEIQASAESNALTLSMRAADGFRPIVIPPGHSTPFPVGS
jgi:hypothetical protein